MIRRPPRSTLDRSSAASDVYKRQELLVGIDAEGGAFLVVEGAERGVVLARFAQVHALSLIHISEPTRPY